MQEIMSRWHSLVSAFVKHFQAELASPTPQEPLAPIRVYVEPEAIYLA